MERSEEFQFKIDAVRDFLKKLTREELLEVRRTTEEFLGYREFIQKCREEGILI